jgi:DNA-binding transcriptional regulator YiaG
MNLLDLIAATERPDLDEPMPPPSERRSLRAKSGFSREDFAAAIGASAKSIGRWERGEVTPHRVGFVSYRRLLAFVAQSDALTV